MTTHLIITGQLTARTAVHIGSGQSNGLTDALIRRNGAGEPIIPGTAIAGALRAMLTRLAPNLGGGECNALKTDKDERGKTCDCLVCNLFGNLNPKDENGSQAKASRLYVFDATLPQTSEVSKTSEVSPSTTIRDGVGINRTTRTAADTAKFDLEVLPAGTIFNLHLELRSYHDGDKIEEIDRQLLAIALSEWIKGRAWLGGRVARGLGGFKLEGVEIIDGDLNQPDQLMAYLRDEPFGEKQKGNTWLADQIKTINIITPKNWQASSPITRQWIRAELTLKGSGPLVANDTTAATISGFDHAPLMAGLAGRRKPVLTGASLRGVIRSHAENIARTLATIQAQDKTEFLKRCPACDPLASRKPNGDAVALESCDSLLKHTNDDTIKAYIRKHDDVKDEHLCLACHLFGSTRRGSRLIVEDAVLEGEPNYKMLDFLAIDRFTGGGTDGAKFDALVLWQPQFKARLYLENPQKWELGWLALTLRDMACGWLHVGLGAAKGLGQVEIGDWRLEIGYLQSDELGQALAAGAELDINGIYQLARYKAGQSQEVWLKEAQKWVNEFNQRIKETRMTTRDGLLPDSYFGRVDDHLYPVEVTLQ